MAIPTDIAGLWGWWKGDSLGLSDLDRVATWPDSSGNGRDMTQGTLSRRPYFRTGVMNYPVLRFAADAWMNPPSMTALTAGTMIVFMRLDFDPPLTEISSGSWQMGTGDGSFYPYYSNGLIYETWGSTVRKTLLSHAQDLSEWHTYAVRSASGAWANYISDALIHSTATNTVGFPAVPEFGHSFTPAVFEAYIHGYVAEVMIFNSALTTIDRELMTDYLVTRYVTDLEYYGEVVSDTPVSYFRMNELTGSVATDFGSASNHGTYNNAPSLGQEGVTQESGVNAAVLFASASSESMTTADHAAYNVSNTFTLEAWVKTTSSGSVMSIMSLGYQAACLRLDATGHVQLHDSQTGTLGTSTATVNDGLWHHIVWTKSGTTSVLYIDAVVSTPTIVDAVMLNTIHGITVGADKNLGGTQSDFMNGSIDEVALYNYPLSAGRVNVHYTVAQSLKPRIPAGMFDSEMRMEQWF